MRVICQDPSGPNIFDDKISTDAGQMGTMTIWCGWCSLLMSLASIKCGVRRRARPKVRRGNWMLGNSCEDRLQWLMQSATVWPGVKTSTKDVDLIGKEISRLLLQDSLEFGCQLRFLHTLTSHVLSLSRQVFCVDLSACRAVLDCGK
jgi:hypothetical protein